MKGRLHGQGDRPPTGGRFRENAGTGPRPHRPARVGGRDRGEHRAGRCQFSTPLWTGRFPVQLTIGGNRHDDPSEPGRRPIRRRHRGRAGPAGAVRPPSPAAAAHGPPPPRPPAPGAPRRRRRAPGGLPRRRPPGRRVPAATRRCPPFLWLRLLTGQQLPPCTATTSGPRCATPAWRSRSTAAPCRRRARSRWPAAPGPAHLADPGGAAGRDAAAAPGGAQRAWTRSTARCWSCATSRS